MSATQAQLDANRINALSSTGPKSEAGKQHSSHNSLNHGLTSKTALLPTEDRNTYRSFCQEFHSDLKPKGILEIELVKTLADAHWRLNRCRDLIHNADADFRALNTLYIYEQRLLRTANTSLKQLRQSQAERHERERTERNDSIAVIQHCRDTKKPFDAAQFGFVCSTEELELAYDQWLALETTRSGNCREQAASNGAR